MSAALRLAYLRATLAQPVSVIDTVSPGKVAIRITESSNTIQVAVSQHFAMLFQALAFTIGCYVVAFSKLNCNYWRTRRLICTLSQELCPYVCGECRYTFYLDILRHLDSSVHEDLQGDPGTPGASFIASL